MRVSIPDTLGEALQAQIHGRRTLDDEVSVRLQATIASPGNRVVLSQQDLNFIAERLGTGLPMTTKIDLDRALDQTAQIHLGNSRLQFTPSQLLQIQARADRVGESLDRFVARIAAKLLEDVFLVQPATDGVFATPSSPSIPPPAVEERVGVTTDHGERPTIRPRTNVFSRFEA